MQTMHDSLEDAGLAAKEHIEHRAKRSLEPIWGIERELRRWGLKAAGNGKRRLGSRSFTALSGWEIEEWCGFSHLEIAFSHLFPGFSTQVVDFPRMAHLSIFWEERFHHRDTEAQSQKELETKVGRLK